MSPARAQLRDRAARLRLRHGAGPHLSGFAADVRAGLRNPLKTLPSKYLYDALGSALFDAITELPEYGLTRAEERILGRNAAEIAATLPRGVQVVGLGAGSGRKTVRVLDAILERQPGLAYAAIDLSAKAQEDCARIVAERPGVRFTPIEATYFDGLARFEALRTGAPVLLMFLGSSIGNFDEREQSSFLQGVRSHLRDGDALLIGFDLVKPADRILAAYDDPLGLTAAFNRNLLARINRELGGEFDLSAFEHEARWFDPANRVEMHLRSLRDQVVAIPGARCRISFVEGETIWTESSHKYTEAGLAELAASAGFTETARWVDGEWAFADSLWTVGSAAVRAWGGSH